MSIQVRPSISSSIRARIATRRPEGEVEAERRYFREYLDRMLLRLPPGSSTVIVADYTPEERIESFTRTLRDTLSARDVLHRSVTVVTLSDIERRVSEKLRSPEKPSPTDVEYYTMGIVSRLARRSPAVILVDKPVTTTMLRYVFEAAVKSVVEYWRRLLSIATPSIHYLPSGSDATRTILSLSATHPSKSMTEAYYGALQYTGDKALAAKMLAYGGYNFSTVEHALLLSGGKRSILSRIFPGVYTSKGRTVSSTILLSPYRKLAPTESNAEHLASIISTAARVDYDAALGTIAFLHAATLHQLRTGKNMVFTAETLSKHSPVSVSEANRILYTLKKQGLIAEHRANGNQYYTITSPVTFYQARPHVTPYDDMRLRPVKVEVTVPTIFSLLSRIEMPAVEVH